MSDKKERLGRLRTRLAGIENTKPLAGYRDIVEHENPAILKLRDILKGIIDLLKDEL